MYSIGGYYSVFISITVTYRETHLAHKVMILSDMYGCPCIYLVHLWLNIIDR